VEKHIAEFVDHQAIVSLLTKILQEGGVNRSQGSQVCKERLELCGSGHVGEWPQVEL